MARHLIFIITILYKYILWAQLIITNNFKSTTYQFIIHIYVYVFILNKKAGDRIFDN